MAEIPQNNEGLKNDLQSIVEKTAEQRAGFTRKFLEQNGKPLASFVEELKKPPFEIIINPENDKSLALGVFNLQKKLGFSEEDNSHGCDGRLGPFTKRAYEGRTVVSKSAGDRSGLMEESVVENEKKAEAVDRNVDMGTVKISETVFVGDSLTFLMEPNLKGADKVAKGGMQTGWMVKNFNNFLAEKKNGMHSNIKRVSILGGFNDLTSLKSISSIKANLTSMYEAAKKADLTVVACTIPEWDYESGRKTFQRTFEKHEWSGGNYPLSVAELELKTKELNEWIKSQAGSGIKVVDLFTEMHDLNKYKRGDFVHLYGKYAANMAALIKDKGGIKDA
ncbi:MAG: hypothetical protein NTZ25_03920 [Candidatus Peregrinibacteria bacterium]|nr:hypothetical protein [Candidatus Peregrinibacteria bacterium]